MATCACCGVFENDTDCSPQVTRAQPSGSCSAEIITLAVYYWMRAPDRLSGAPFGDGRIFRLSGPALVRRILLPAVLFAAQTMETAVVFAPANAGTHFEHQSWGRSRAGKSPCFPQHLVASLFSYSLR